MTQPITIGAIRLTGNLALAPMAGVTDAPFRKLCREMGASIAASEMLTSDTRLYDTRKSQRRRIHGDEMEPRTVQIAGGDVPMMIEAAQRNVDEGAQIIDINMGCPAKKVCNKAAGSALLRDEELVRNILHSVVKSVAVPVTVKIRTGWSPEMRNGIRIAQIAQDAGIAALAVHGRTRACKFLGNAEYDTIAAIKSVVQIPVFANGDIDSPQKAQHVLQQTGADGVMIGRTAQGNPWIFREIDHFLRTGKLLPPPSIAEVRAMMRAHLRNLHAHYGEWAGTRVARKHIAWYAKHWHQQWTQDGPLAEQLRAAMQSESASTQLAAVDAYCDLLASHAELLTAA